MVLNDNSPFLNFHPLIHRMPPNFEQEHLSIDERLKEMTSSAIEIIKSHLSYQKEVLESLCGGHLSLMQMHALEKNVFDSFDALQNTLLEHPDAKEIPIDRIESFIRENIVQTKEDLHLPQSMPSLPSSKNMVKMMDAKAGIQSSAGEMPKHTFSKEAPSPASNMNSFSNQIFDLLSNFFSYKPDVAKYNVTWLRLSSEFLQYAKKGEANKAMAIYQKLSYAVNQNSGNTK